ncbi:MAG: polyprenyl synthetase [Spirochaetae bacterium HGW-Spirochaetae-3]|nr:MAG: polyprenyl synthetase [Spirochaetae bacterium HGW-Spirochaetae-3]
MNDVLDYIFDSKPGIRAALKEILARYGDQFDAVSADFGAGLAARLDDFCSRGKMLRGCLVRLGYELASGRVPAGDDERALTEAGAAMELFQAGLLVHDDIMDRDRVRRGATTVHAAYETDLANGRYDDPAHNGESLGVCAGDIAYFAAFRALSELPVSDGAARRVMALSAKELALVGVAQMQDVANGAIKRGSSNPFRDGSCEPDDDSILRLYSYKTGRYTFSLPLALGAAIAEADDGTRSALEEAGESLGVLFQLKDDELGLFADEAELGKPVGADIRENKKTLFRLRLFQRAGGELRSRLEAVFGNRGSGEAESAFVREALEREGIRAEIAATMDRYAEEAVSRAGTVLQSATEEAAAAFRELVAYSLERRS